MANGGGAGGRGIGGEGIGTGIVPVAPGPIALSPTVNAGTWTGGANPVPSRVGGAGTGSLEYVEELIRYWREWHARNGEPIDPALDPDAFIAEIDAELEEEQPEAERRRNRVLGGYQQARRPAPEGPLPGDRLPRPGRPRLAKVELLKVRAAKTETQRREALARAVVAQARRMERVRRRRERIRKADEEVIELLVLGGFG